MSDQVPTTTSDGGWDAHRRAQIRAIAAGTTVEQRFEWLEQTIESLRPQLPQLLENRQKVAEFLSERKAAQPAAPQTLFDDSIS